MYEDGAQQQTPSSYIISCIKQISYLFVSLVLLCQLCFCASHTACCEGTSSVDMLREDLIAKRIAVETYSEMVRYFGDKDPTCGTQMQSA